MQRVHTQQAGMLRIHVLTPKGRQVYFEATRYDSLSAESEYRRHREYLVSQFDTIVISQLQATTVASVPAYAYSFEWDQGARRVLLVEQAPETYRIIYNPRFPVNLQILSTVEWLSRP
ncbi:MAG TPA: hypothetical protein VGK56_18210 [Anaerolineales bacterium]